MAGTAPNQTFQVNGVHFVMNSSTELRDLAGGLAAETFVEVKTQSTTSPFTVTRIEALSGDFESPENEVRGASKASVEGFVAGLTGASPDFSFTLSGTRVSCSSATTVGLGLVVANAHIEAEGPVSATGVIKATRITSRP